MLITDVSQPWMELDGVLYGARPDEEGPLGGGAGYARVVTTGDHEVSGLDELIEALAVAKAGETVFIPGDVVIDCTTLIYIEDLVLEIPAGVTLASDRGVDGSPGALLASDALDTPVLLRPLGPDVRVTGLRLRGPEHERRMYHHRRCFQTERGHDYYYKFPTSDGIKSDQDDLEVDNCEICGFAHGGVFLRHSSGHRVHHCYIHHCQYNGLGYGVSLDAAATAITHNLFNCNRHSIAGTGRAGTSYEAAHNVELGVSLSHCFDMHGGRDRKDSTDVAGSNIHIHHNAFFAPQTPIVIRGAPEELVRIHNNWFAKHMLPASGDRHAVYSEGKVDMQYNHYGG